ncbi:MAG TPA: hypothetical protein DCY35_03770 [Prolixibacteraceae bacterium]|nr:hypothetical protein [Prolixibacteraceae bacterium]
MGRYLYNQAGSVDDIRCSLRFINPETFEQAVDIQQTIIASLENELANRKRVSVVRMLEGKYKYIQKRIAAWKTR